jgi:hypothetical protein
MEYKIWVACEHHLVIDIMVTALTTKSVCEYFAEGENVDNRDAHLQMERHSKGRSGHRTKKYDE